MLRLGLERVLLRTSEAVRSRSMPLLWQADVGRGKGMTVPDVCGRLHHLLHPMFAAPSRPPFGIQNRSLRDFHGQSRTRLQ